jgi:hypothetical protein
VVEKANTLKFLVELKTQKLEDVVIRFKNKN